MSIERTDKFDIMRMTFGNTVQEIKNSKDKMYETEMAIALTEKKLCVKIGNEIYSIPMDLEAVVVNATEGDVDA